MSVWKVEPTPEARTCHGRCYHDDDGRCESRHVEVRDGKRKTWRCQLHTGHGVRRGGVGYGGHLSFGGGRRW